MSPKAHRNIITGILIGLVFAAAFLLGTVANAPTSKSQIPVVQPEDHTPEQIFRVAKVFGRGSCGNYNLAAKVVKVSLKNQIDPALEAAIIVTESHCNPLAVNPTSGAIGLSQILVKTWSKENDFSKINLFNPDENMDLSTRILHKLIAQYGNDHLAVLHYGPMDNAYVVRVFSLAEIK